MRALKSLTTTSNWDTTEQVEKTIRSLTKKRKQRHTKLKEIIALEDSENPKRSIRRNINCPICFINLCGDIATADAHIDACITHASEQQSRTLERIECDPWEEYVVEGETRLRIRDAAALSGTGFQIRNRNLVDMDGEVDIDGTDEVQFGHAQFTEQDVLMASTYSDSAIDVETEDMDESSDAVVNESSHSEQKVRNFSDLGVKAQILAVDKQIERARQGNNSARLVTALQDKIRQLVSVQHSLVVFKLVTSCLRKRLRHRQYHHPHRVVYASKNTMNPRYLQGVGTHAAASAGLDALDRRNCVPYASELLQPPNCGVFICRNLNLVRFS